MTLKIEVLYDDDTHQTADADNMSEIMALTKTGVLAIVLWEPVGTGQNRKRKAITYKDETDNYVVIVDQNLGYTILQGWDDVDIVPIRNDNPSVTGGYPQWQTPPGMHNLQSADSMSFHFLGALVDPQVWLDTKAERDGMFGNERDV